MDESNHGKRMDAGLKASLVRYAGGVVLETHCHAAGGISIVLAGQIEEEVGNRTECGRVGSIVAKPAGLEHRNRVGRDGAILLAIKGREADDIAARGWRWAGSRRAAVFGLQLARHLKTDGGVDTEQLIELLGYAISGRPHGAPKPTWLDEIRSLVDRESAVTPVSTLAQHADVHPVYLARAFRTHFGCSIREYRRNLRVRRAADLLTRGDLSIAAIAARLDFFDQSHLCRDFKAELNVSPSNYRKIVRS